MNDYIREIAREEAWRVMKLVFAAEFVLYITVLGLVITRREKKLAAKKAAYARRQRRRARLALQDASARRLVSTTTANAGHIAA